MDDNVVSIGGAPVNVEEVLAAKEGETVEQVWGRLLETCPDAKNVFVVAFGETDDNIYTFSNIPDIRDLYWYLSIIMHETMKA